MIKPDLSHIFTANLTQVCPTADSSSSVEHSVPLPHYLRTHAEAVFKTVFNFWNFCTITQWLSTCKELTPTPLHPQATVVIHCVSHIYHQFPELLYLLNWTKCALNHNTEFVTFLLLHIFSIKSLEVQPIACRCLQNLEVNRESTCSTRPDDGPSPKPCHAKCNIPLPEPYTTVLLQINVNNNINPWYGTHRWTQSTLLPFFQVII